MVKNLGSRLTRRLEKSFLRDWDFPNVSQTLSGVTYRPKDTWFSSKNVDLKFLNFVCFENNFIVFVVVSSQLSYVHSLMSYELNSFSKLLFVS